MELGGDQGNTPIDISDEEEDIVAISLAQPVLTEQVSLKEDQEDVLFFDLPDELNAEQIYLSDKYTSSFRTEVSDLDPPQLAPALFETIRIEIEAETILCITRIPDAIWK